MSAKTEAHADHGHEEFIIPIHLRERPLGTVMLWKPEKAHRHFSAVHRIGALSDDLVMMEKDIVTKNDFAKKKLEASAKNHADKIINANRFYQNKIGKELEILYSLAPEMAERTSNFLRSRIENMAKAVQTIDSEQRRYERILDRLGIASNSFQSVRERRNYRLAA